MKITRDIAEALFPINANMRQHNSETTAVREAQREAAVPIITAKLEEFHRTTKVRLQSVEYALDPSPKWADTEHPPMTQAEALSMVRCVLATLSEEAS